MTDKQKNCTHPKFRFKRLKVGVQRKCKRCGWHVTEVAQGIFGVKENHQRPNTGRRKKVVEKQGKN